MLWDEPKIFFLERRYFFSIILSEFLKNRVALQCVLRILLLLLRQVGFVLHRRIRATADEREEHHEREQPCGQLFFHICPPVVIFSIIARPRAKIQHARRLTLRAVVSTIGETTGKSEWIKKQRR